MGVCPHPGERELATREGGGAQALPAHQAPGCHQEQEPGFCPPPRLPGNSCGTWWTEAEKMKTTPDLPQALPNWRILSPAPRRP